MCIGYYELKRLIGKTDLTNKAFVELIGVNPKAWWTLNKPKCCPLSPFWWKKMKDRGIDYEEFINKAIIKW